MAATVEARPSSWSIRPCRAEDRAEVRALCCGAAGGAAPLEGFFPDPELWADLMTGYYLEVEPQRARVGIADGELAGYVLGCVDTQRQRRWQLLHGVPGALRRFVLRGGLRRRLTWSLLAANVRLEMPRGRGAGSVRRSFPAHLHVAVAAPRRHRGLGTALVTTLLDELARAGVPGVHAVVRDDNPGAQRFFANLGFAPRARCGALRRPGERRARKVLYARSFAVR